MVITLWGHFMNDYLASLRKFILDELKSENVKVILFGSRARGDEHPSSDVDIGIIPVGKFDKNKITFLREKTEGLNIPYKVEFILLSEVSEEFKDAVLKEAVVWKDCF